MTVRLLICAVAALALVGCDPLRSLLRGDDPGEAPSEGEGDATEADVAELVPTDLEIEPNDTPEQATRLTMGRGVVGSVLGGDVDMFSLPFGAESVSVSITTDGALTVELLSTADFVAARATASDREPLVWDASASDRSLRVVLRGEGSYTILAVEPANEPTLCGILRDTGTPDQAAATLMRVPSALSGCLTSPGEVHHLRLAASSLAAVTGLGVDVGAVEGVALSLRLIDGSGSVIADVSGAVGEGVAVPNLRAPTAGDLRIEVASLSGFDASEPYRLTVSELPTVPGVLELENNDRDDTAFVFDRTLEVTGFIHRSGDVDHFRVAAGEPAVIRVTATPPADLDLRLTVQTADGRSTTFDGNGVGGVERACAQAVAVDEEIAFSVAAGSGERSALPYSVSVELLEDDFWEVEPNDDLGTVLAAGQRSGAGPDLDVVIWLDDARVASEVHGVLSPSGDVDRFLIEVDADVEADATYQSVTLRVEPNGALDVRLELVDEDGAPVGVADAGGVAESEVLALDLPSGRYVATVSFVAGDPCERPYRLSVEKTGFPVDRFALDPAAPGATDEAVDGVGGEGELTADPGEVSPADDEAARDGAPDTNERVEPSPAPPRIRLERPAPTAPRIEAEDRGADRRPNPLQAVPPPSSQPPTFGGSGADR